MPEGTHSGRGRARTVLGVAGGLLLCVIAVGAVTVIVSRGGGLPEPLAPVTPPPVALPETTLPPSDPEEEDVRAAAATSPPRVVTEADAVEFASSYDPPRATGLEFVIVDLEGDGPSEVVVASIAEEVVRIDVAQWDGEQYRVSFTGRGGPAEAIEEFAVRDVTGDGVREVVVHQRAPGRRSLALWGVGEDGIVRQEARGGCWDGSHVFGQFGAEVASGEITATCDPSAENPPPGGSQRYVWDGEAWNADIDDPELDRGA